jgi:hypothetical protein
MNLFIGPITDEHLRNFVGVIMRITYGYSIDSLDDLFVKVAEETVAITDRTMANGSWLVDYYPIGKSSATWSSPFSKRPIWQFAIFLLFFPEVTSNERGEYGGTGYVTCPMFLTNG